MYNFNTLVYNLLKTYFYKIRVYGSIDEFSKKESLIMLAINELLTGPFDLTKDELLILRGAVTVFNRSITIAPSYSSNYVPPINGDVYDELTFIDTFNNSALGLFGVDFTVEDNVVTAQIKLDIVDGGSL